MKKLILPLLILLLFGNLIACQNQSKDVIKNIPPLSDVRGKVLRLSDYSGKWIVINYWATWCTPCRKEIPELNRFSADHLKKGDAVVFAVNFDHLTSAKLREAIAKFNIKYMSLLSDPLEYFYDQPLDVVPVTFVFNPEGKLAKIFYGEINQAKLEQEMLN